MSGAQKEGLMLDTTQIWLAVIAIIPVTIASITAAIVALRTHSLARDTHTLVNSNMGATLESYAMLATRMAKITSDPEDVAVANAAMVKYQHHQTQQAIVDHSHTPLTTPRTDP